MGLALLFLRIFTHDSGMFERMRTDNRISKGSLKLLLGRPKSLVCFLSCVAAGAPIYLTFSIFASLSPEVAPAFGVKEPILVPEVMLAVSIGMTAGDVFAGALSQFARSRKVPLLLLIISTGVIAALIMSGIFPSRDGFLILVGLLGLFSGYWACLITTSSEQFGTNIRATVTTMVPNLIRATAILMTTAFVYLQNYTTVRIAVITIVTSVFFVALLGVSRLKETFSRDLNFYE